MTFDDLLDATASLHDHLCPRQVLGVRIGVCAGKLLGLSLPQRGKRLLAIVETDGCAADGIAVATGCWVGKRTLRVEDFGKVAATFVDTWGDHAVRIAPHPRAREFAAPYAPEANGRWEAQLIGYQRMPDDLLLTWCRVELTTSIAALVSRPGLRVCCQVCGEEIMNEREVVREGRLVCRACAGNAYYRVVADASAPQSPAGQP